MTPFKAYLCTLPTEEKYFLSLKSNSISIDELCFEYLIENSNFPMREISQLKATEDGYVSFVFNNAFYPHLALIYNQYNGVILEKEHETNHEIYYMLYRIIKIKYSSSTNVEIIAEPSQQVLYDYAVHDTHFNMCPNSFNFKTSYLEWGYQKESVYKLNNNRYYINYDSKMETDLYCKPPFDIKCDLLKVKHQIKLNMIPDFTDLSVASDRTKWTHINNGDGVSNKGLNDCLWEVIFIQNETMRTKYLNNDGELVDNPLPLQFFHSYESLANPEENAQVRDNLQPLPYSILFAPICKSKTQQYRLMGYDSINNTENEFSLKGILNYCSPYILSYQVLPYMSLKGLLISDFQTSNNEQTYHIDENLISAYTYVNHDTCWLNDGRGNRKYCYFGYNVVPRQPIKNLYGFGNDFYSSFIPNFPNSSVNENEAKNNLNSYEKNPYVYVHTTKYKITFNDGQAYEFSPLMLGSTNIMGFKCFLSLTPNVSKLYITLDNYNLEGDSVFRSGISDSGGWAYEETYHGLNISFDNNLLFQQDMLQNFLAQNKNFFLQKRLTYDENIALATIRGMDKFMVGGIGSAMTGNPVGAVSGSLGMVSELAKSEIGNLYDMEKTAMQMDNLENAPNQMKGGTNNLYLENAVSRMKCYFEVWQASDLVKKSLLETFLEKGIYINRYMDPEEIEKYFTFDSTGLDKQFKYIKGNFEFYNSYWINQMNLPYNKLVNNLRNGLFLVSIDQAKDYLPLILQQQFNSDTIIKLHYNEEEFGEWS